MTDKCRIVPMVDGGLRCLQCRAQWDRDDTAPCQAATRAHDESLERSNRYVSALPPPPWER